MIQSWLDQISDFVTGFLLSELVIDTSVIKSVNIMIESHYKCFIFLEEQICVSASCICEVTITAIPLTDTF